MDFWTPARELAPLRFSRSSRIRAGESTCSFVQTGAKGKVLTLDSARGAYLAGRRLFWNTLAILFSILVLGLPARAQLSSNPAAVNLQAALTSSLSVSTSPSLVSFTLVPGGTATGSNPISITTSWVLQPNVGNVTLYAYFTSAAVALTDGAGDNIPSASVEGSPNNGAFAPFSGTSPFAAGSSQTIFRVNILGNNKTATRTDTLALRINLTGLSLPAGTYTGLLRLQAEAL
jgi:hypothetical protein